MLPERVKHYLLIGLGGTPEVLERLLHGITDQEADRRPDPNRFTIREALAHLADWEGVFQERILLTLQEEYPRLQGYDEGQWAIDHDYTHSDLKKQMALFRVRRNALTSLLTALSSAQWERLGEHTEVGSISIESQVVLISVHDAYHSRQIAEWRLWG